VDGALVVTFVATIRRRGSIQRRRSARRRLSQGRPVRHLTGVKG
jgi:hypothetical protein